MRLITLLVLLYLSMALVADGETPPFTAAGGASLEKSAYISGRVMIQGKTPMADGLVFLFNKSMGPPPSQEINKYWRVPDRITPVDENGRFSFEVVAGTYYLTSGQKDLNAEVGPPQVEELNYFHGDTEGNPRPIIVTPGSRVDLGVLVPTLWSPNTINRDKGITAIEGMVSDMEGKPVEGALVFAYLSKNVTGRPVFISDKTGKNGKYLLRVHDGGTFYLKVRSIYGGGTPEEGEFLNVTKDFEPVMVSLKKEQRLQGVQLKVKRFSRGAKDSKQ